MTVSVTPPVYVLSLCMPLVAKKGTNPEKSLLMCKMSQFSWLPNKGSVISPLVS